MTPQMLAEGLRETKRRLERTLRVIDGLLAGMEDEPEPEPPRPDGCPHAHTADVSTLQHPGGRLCLDCNEVVSQST